MKRNIAFKAFYLLASIVVLINTFYNLHGDLFSDLEELPKGSYLYSVSSPSKEMTLNVYRIKNSIGCGVRCQLEYADCAKNIFWQTDIEDVQISWRYDDVVVINGMPISVPSGSYDCRRGMSILQEGVIDGTARDAE